MKLSDIKIEANKIIKDIFGKLETKEDYQKAFASINDVILPKKAREGGIELHIWQNVQRQLATKFSKLFIKKK